MTSISKARSQAREIRELRNEQNELEQYSRRSHIIIYGLHEPPPENHVQLRSEITDLLVKGYKLDLQADDIDVCHRIGRSTRGDNSRPTRIRPIIVRFLRRNTKDRLFPLLKQNQVRGIRVFHDLTHANIKLLEGTRHHDRIETAWVSNGKVIAKGINGHILRVDLLTDIDAELGKYNNNR